MTTLELICWAEDRHRHYCWLATKFLGERRIHFREPNFELFASKGRYAGWAKYGKRVCSYNLSFLLASKEEFEQTIAHEVAHFVIRSISIDAKSHGDLFMFVLKYVMGGKVEQFHKYTCEPKHIIQAAALMKLVKLNTLKDAAEKSSK